MSTTAYPFTAIVGQDEMKTALLIAAVEPRLGGVLVLGDRGTGKSTAIRALAALLPKIRVIEGCRFGCDPADTQALCPECLGQRERKIISRPVPVVDLPLGATEDRVAGALDLERALRAGVRAFEPGLLARAHRGYLYIDEVNLLEDHLVDLLLDVAASGENIVERDGLSIRHTARFVLIGSGNPEEGELRPQLLDRFGLAVEVRTPETLEERVSVIKRRDAFEAEPKAFVRLWEKEEKLLRARLIEARRRREHVRVPDAIVERAAKLCMGLGTDGLRGELTLIRAARALAALRGALVVGDEHLQIVAPMALRHRLRRDPLDETVATARVARAVEELFAA